MSENNSARQWQVHHSCHDEQMHYIVGRESDRQEKIEWLEKHKCDQCLSAEQAHEELETRDKCWVKEHNKLVKKHDRLVKMIKECEVELRNSVLRARLNEENQDE